MSKRRKILLTEGGVEFWKWSMTAFPATIAEEAARKRSSIISVFIVEQAVKDYGGGAGSLGWTEEVTFQAVIQIGEEKPEGRFYLYQRPLASETERGSARPIVTRKD